MNDDEFEIVEGFGALPKRLDKSEGLSLRKEVVEFAHAMEFKLKKNDHKKGWRELPVEALVEFLEIELQELKAALKYLSKKEAQGEAVDLSNFSMMLWDRLRVE